MRKLLVLFLFLLLSVSSNGFMVYEYISEGITPGSEGFSKVFLPFDSSPFAVFSSPQSLDVSQNYSLGFSLNNIPGSTIPIVSGYFKPFGFPLNIGLGIQGNSDVAFDDFGNAVGTISEGFIMFGLGSKLSNLFSFDFADFDFGASLVFSSQSWHLSWYNPSDYFLENFFVFNFGTLARMKNVDFSLTTRFFLGGFFGDFSFGNFTELGARFSPLSLFFDDRKLWNYFYLYPIVGLGFIRDFPSDSGFVNSYQSFIYGIGVSSEPLEGLKISFSVDNKSLSLSLILSFLSSPLGIGNISSSSYLYQYLPSVYLIFGEKGVKQVLGITPDKEEVEKGILEFEKGNFNESKKHFDRALSYNPTNEVALIYIQKLKTRLESDEWLTAEQKEFIKTLLTRAQVLKSQGQYGDAIKEYKKVLEVNPYNSEALDGIKEIEKIVSDEINKNYRDALSLFSQNKLFDAKSVISSNFNLNPYHEPTLKLAKEIDDRIALETSKKLEEQQKIDLSYSLYRQGLQEFSSYNFAKALEFFNKAIDVYPDNKDAIDYRNKTLKEIEISSKIKQDKAKSDALVVEGVNLRNNGDYWGAIGKFREAISYYNQNNVAYNELSNTIQIIKSNAFAYDAKATELFGEGKFTDAFDNWNEAIKLLKDLPEAISIAQKVSNKMEELKSNIDIRITKARTLLENKDYVGAMNEAKSVLIIQSNNSDAIRVFSEAKTNYDKIVDSLLNEGISLYKSSSYDLALSKFDSLANIIDTSDPRYPSFKNYYDETKKKVNELNVSYRIKEGLSKVEGLMANYDYEGAMKVLKDISSIDPNNKEVQAKLKEVEAKSKEFALREEVSKLISSGLRSIRKGDYVSGINDLKQAKEKSLTLGDDTSLIDNYISKAEEEYKLYKDKSFSEGKAAYEKGDYITAKEKLDLALKNNPGSSEIKLLLSEVNNKLKDLEKELLDKGDNLFAKGQYDDAIKVYNDLLRINSDNELYKFKVDNAQKISDGIKQVNNLVNSQEYTEALDLVEDLLNINPSDSNLVSLKDTVLEKLLQMASRLKAEADSYIKNEQYRKAISRLEIVVKANPSDNEAKSKLQFANVKLNEKINNNLELARNAYSKGDYKSAILYASKVLEESPGDKIASQILVQAKNEYNSILEQNKESLDKEIAKYMAMGMENYRKGNVNEAINNWKKVLELDPNNDQAKRYIARAQLGQ